MNLSDPRDKEDGKNGVSAAWLLGMGDIEWDNNRVDCGSCRLALESGLNLAGPRQGCAPCSLWATGAATGMCNGISKEERFFRRSNYSVRYKERRQ